MSSKKQREMLRLRRMEFDRQVEEARKARESDLTEQEKKDLTPKKKPAKSKNKAPQGKEKK